MKIWFQLYNIIEWSYLFFVGVLTITVALDIAVAWQQNKKNDTFMFVKVDYIVQREMRVCDLLGSCLVGKCLYFQIETTCCIIYRLSILWGEKGDRKWDDHMGEWSVPRMECWLTVGRADRGLGPEWMWGWNAVAMGTVKWRWEARWNNFIDHLTVHIYKHNIPPLVGK